jgi:hypothetical protein
MARTPSEQDEEHLLLVHDCQSREHHLSEWEREFVESLVQRLKTRALTKGEIDKLNEVWEKATAKG